MSDNKEELKEQKEYCKNLIKEYNKELCKNLGLPKDFLELDAFDYMFIYSKLLYELYGDSINEEKLKEQLKEQVLNELQSSGLKTNRED